MDPLIVFNDLFNDHQAQEFQERCDVNFDDIYTYDSIVDNEYDDLGFLILKKQEESED